MRNFINLVENHARHREDCHAAEEVTCSCHFDESLNEEELDEHASMKYDLKSKYRQFNHDLFDNQLPQDIALSWSSMTKNTGVFRYKILPTEEAHRYGKKNPLRKGYIYLEGSGIIKISNVHERSEADLDKTLIHEMIHVYHAAVRGEIMENHGPNFNATRKRISQKAGFEIPLTDIPDAPLKLNAEAVNIRPLVVFLWDKNDGSKRFAILNKTSASKVLSEIIDMWTGFCNRQNSKFAIYEIQNAEWTALTKTFGVKEQRSEIKLTYRFPPDKQDDLVGILKSDGKVLHQM